MRITIPGQTRAKKNSMKIATYGKGPKAPKAIRPSTIYAKWEKQALNHVRKQGYKAWDGDYPLELVFFLFRDSKRTWDIDNVFCGCQDILQQTKIIIQDTANHIIPVFSGWAIDVKNPRAELLLRPVTKQYFREDLCIFNK